MLLGAVPFLRLERLLGHDGRIFLEAGLAGSRVASGAWAQAERAARLGRRIVSVRQLRASNGTWVWREAPGAAIGAGPAHHAEVSAVWLGENAQGSDLTRVPRITRKSAQFGWRRRLGSDFDPMPDENGLHFRATRGNRSRRDLPTEIALHFRATRGNDASVPRRSKRCPDEESGPTGYWAGEGTGQRDGRGLRSARHPRRPDRRGRATRRGTPAGLPPGHRFRCCRDASIVSTGDVHLPGSSCIGRPVSRRRRELPAAAGGWLSE
jgi:hypothetical protein